MPTRSKLLVKPALPLLFCLVLFSGVLRAQTETERPPTSVQFRITRFDPKGRPPLGLHVLDGDALSPVEVPINYIAGSYKATLRDHLYLDFFTTDSPIPFISVKIPPGRHKDLLLVFLPGKGEKGEGTYAVIPIHLPLAKLKGGERFLLNASKTPVAIKYGEAEPVVIAPRGTGRVLGPGGSEVVSLPVTVLEKRPEGWRPFSTSFWPYDPRERKIMFIYRSERTKHLKLHVVSDRVDLAPSETE